MEEQEAHVGSLYIMRPEPTPLLEAAQLQTDLRRAGMEPCAWVINGSLSAAGPTEPLRRQRADAELEQRWNRKVHEQWTSRAVIVP